MEDAYSKAMTKEGATPESVVQAALIIGEKAHAYAAHENARRIRQWAEAILAAEADWEQENGIHTSTPNNQTFCQICRHPSPEHEKNCPVLTGEPQAGRIN